MQRTSTIGIVLVVLAMSWTLHGQSSSSLETQVAALTKQVAALEQKLASVQPQGSRVKAPFEVVDDAGKTIVRINALANGGADVMMGSAASGGLRLGTGASGAGFVAVRRANGVMGASIGEYKSGPMGVQVFDTSGDGSEPVARLSPGGNSKGEISLGASGSGGALMAVGASGAGVLTVRRADGLVSLSLGQHKGQPMGVQVFGASGNQGEPLASLGSYPAGGGSITVTDSAAKAIFQVGEKAMPRDARVVVGAGDGAYGVKVSAASGTQLASFGEAKNGAGAVSTFDKTGALRAVMNGLQGEIHVVDATGVSRATMVAADNQGAFSIRNKSGTTVLRLSEGTQAGGLLQIANSGGNAMVEAGILPDGVGAVRAYPLGSPGVGLVGMPGTFIMGLGPKK